MFNFTSLQGAQSDSRASQSILELDGGVKVLVDVGWDERFDTRQLAELEKHVSTLSFILLTHATTAHLGAFAHCSKHVPSFTQIPVYATSPVIAFGRTLVQDLYSSTPLAATFIPGTASPEDDSATNDRTRSNILRQAPTFEEINKYFSLINPLKYSQPLQPTASQFSAPLEGLTLTAYNSGHTLGGTIWHIQHGMESIVYAVDWNQARENVIAGAAWFGGVGGSEVIEQLRKPTAMVCSSVGGDKVALPGGRKARDEALLGHIRSALARGGTVLIPSDSSARILELAWILERAWQDGMKDETVKNARVYMASKSAHATLRHARSLLEWMDDSIVREFEGEEDTTASAPKRSGGKLTDGGKSSRPFDFHHVKVVEKKAQLERILKGEGPRVILASDLSLEWGYSRQAFEQIAQKGENLVVLTERLSVEDMQSSLTISSMNHRLWQWYHKREDGVAVERTTSGEQLEQVYTNGRMLSMHDVHKAPLDQAENQRYQQFMATQQQMQDSLASHDELTATAAEDAIDDASSSSSDESDDEHQGRALNVSTALGHASRNKVAVSDEELGVSILLRKKGVYDFDVRNKRGRNAVFPYTHTRKRGDEFGDFIKPEDFLREEEKEEEQNAADAKMGALLGQKRKWDDVKKSKNEASVKRQRGQKAAETNEDAADDDDSDESGEEIEVERDDTQGPAKVVYTETSITVNARLAFVDFAGLHDQRSLQMLIPLVGPKKLILTGGNAKETQTLAADCKELLGMRVVGEEETAAEIFSPTRGQIIDASVDTNAWIVKLTRDLAMKLHWQNLNNMGIVTISGQLKAEPVGDGDLQDDAQTKKMKLDTAKSEQTKAPQVSYQSFAAQPVLDVLPPSFAASTRSTTQPIYVGDLRLAALRRALQEPSGNQGGATPAHTAEFRGSGTLLVDGIIAVKKQASGRIVVEGVPYSAENRAHGSFAEVKKRIYDSLAVIAAG